MNGLRLALGLLTLIPVPAPDGVDRDAARRAMLLAPLALLPISLAAALAGWGCLLLGLPGLVAGIVTVAVGLLATGALHADGLADTADGLGSRRDPQTSLAIMKRGDVGPMGAVALALVYLAQAAAVPVLLARPWGWLQVALLLAGARVALAVLTRRGQAPARPGGLGALVLGTVPVPSALVAVLVAWLITAATGWLTGHLIGAIVALPLALAAVLWLSRTARRRLGGLTGDVLGAGVELAATVMLIVASIAW
ncbi:cobalamin-5'-phosphate synthase [Propionicimonas paludicola]|uniref:Adenosylcobinamide-GDP ribazoletransferase n=1 Tax=Propionicimonas paludicola TaxID=185243 RepID=A0A2A9CVU9_9ACTN|nr:adenosylcobinamide-GDP ribazoletransferase [Propionicimonas paludicola]PFG18145.1 cobalamin-5'-phosphate synthase [Propionicimonas paludicola]